MPMEEEPAQANGEGQTTVEIVKPMPRNRSYQKPKTPLLQEETVHRYIDDQEGQDQ